MQEVKTHADVGVIVARFHVDELTLGQRQLIDHVCSDHDKVIIYLGLAPVRGTRNNPLDFESRKQMVLADYPNVTVLYIKDTKKDDVWSATLDAQLADVVGPTQSVMMYGSRESFITPYSGKHHTTELQQEVFVSGTETRNRIGRSVKASKDFRTGAIWSAYNRFPNIMPTVDIAIWDETHERLLMARKDGEKKYRFIGGFADGKTSFEADARREVMEEAHIEISTPLYLCSMPVDDWRYRREADSIVTTFFEATHVFGKPTPDDDIVELKWFDVKTISEADIVKGHRPLLRLLLDKEDA
jgi:bifunctional NMN adenylyltransferase/nudix hydrolase